MEKVNLAIIGCGMITERACLPNLANHEKVNIKVLCDIDKDAALDKVKKFNLKDVKIKKGWRSVVKRDDIDAVYIATPNYLHAPMAIEAANNKKDILIEKPLTISMKAADKIVEAVEKNDVLCMVEQTQRFDPVHKAVKKALDSGMLGKVNMVKGRIGHAGPEYWSKTSRWFNDVKKSGGGAMIDIGVHILDLLRWLSGKKIVAVLANIQRLEKKVDVDDNGNVLFKFEDGTIGEFECSWTTRPYEVDTFFYGQKGKLSSSLSRADKVIATLATTGQDQDPNCVLEEVKPEISEGSGWTNAMNYFIDCVLKREKPFVDAKEGRATIEVILAAYKSAKKGKWVKLPLSR